jgi:hypothetical protein
MKAYRVYFNARHDPDGAWSVDSGTQTDEQCFDEVRIDGRIQSTYTGDRPNPTRPVAWFETTGELRVEGRIAIIG